MASKNGKPTNKQRDFVIGELIKAGENIHNMVRQLDIIVGMYIEFNGDKEKFDEFIIKTQEKMKKEKEENDAKADGNADKPNLQGDTDGESSGTEGIREKE